jgi:hypothetical protein
MEYGMEKGKAEWVVRYRAGKQMRHFGEPESAKALCGVKLWTAKVQTTGAIPCQPYCARCLTHMRMTVLKLTLEIVSYYFARGKNWTEEQVEQFEGYQDMHLWLTQAISQADKSYEPLDWAEQISRCKRVRAERGREVANG